MTRSTSMTSDVALQWTLLIPVKQTAVAKSRLAALAGPLRAELARAMAMDCVHSALACPVVRAVVVVTDDPASPDFVRAGAVVIPDVPGGGLNPALAYAAERVRLEGSGGAVAALSADLPALRGDELAAALNCCRQGRRYVSDASGTGTTMLAAVDGTDLAPQFGRNSATAHQASGAVPIDLAGIDSVRRDVDTPDDLAEAIRLGLGPATTVVVDRLESLHRAW
jgi:2-phospho-L-lactate guanylyltransferase